MKYHGSKTWLAPLIDRLLPEVSTLVSPFFGSGKVELRLLRRPGLRIKGSDAWQPLVKLYAAALTRPGELAARLRESQTLTREQYRELLRTEFEDEVDEGARVFRVLYHSFNGWWGKYVLRPKPPHTRSSSLWPLLESADYRERLEVTRRDVFDVLADPRGDVLYLDPPYLKPEVHYPCADHSVGFHRRLADALKACPVPFALSLNDVPEAKELYSWCRVLEPKAGELLFLWPPDWWRA
jgi:site-specific DNA-adenine methylase